MPAGWKFPDYADTVQIPSREIMETLNGKEYRPVRLIGTSGQTLLEVLDSGVRASIAGAEATQPFVFPGMIVMWHGLSSEIPAGWALCDGTNGTPDLRDRFIVGAGSTYALNATGGAATVNLEHTHIQNAHNHTHDHEVSIDHNHDTETTSEPSSSRGVTDDGTSQQDVAATNHTHTVNLSDYDVPSRTTDSDSTGETAVNQNALSTTQSVLPPYYGLFFIKRIAA